MDVLSATAGLAQDALRFRTAPQGTERAEAAARDFEAFFFSYMAGEMLAGVESGPFGAGPGEPFYRTMLAEEFGRVVARAGGLGIAESVRGEMLRIQEET